MVAICFQRRDADFSSFADKVDRPISTCIYFLLPSSNVSRLHRIPCAETWHFYYGEPIYVSITLKYMENDILPVSKSAKLCF